MLPPPIPGMIGFIPGMVPRLVQGSPAGVRAYLPRNYLSRSLGKAGGMETDWSKVGSLFFGWFT